MAISSIVTMYGLGRRAIYHVENFRRRVCLFLRCQLPAGAMATGK